MSRFFEKTTLAGLRVADERQLPGGICLSSFSNQGL
jgi:hypothetical protein